jgi:UDP-3-O-[3-hydroxymyristoyl] glucosamine N-acyltransferase
MKSYTLSEIAQHIGAELEGDPDKIIQGIAPLSEAQSTHLAFLDNAKYRKFLTQTRAGAVIIHPSERENCGVDVLLSSNPYVAYAKVAQLFANDPTIPQGIHPLAQIGHACHIAESASIGAHVVIGNDVTIGEGTVIFPGCYLGDGVTIGAHCVIHPRVTLYHDVVLHDRIIIHAGAVIGADGFGMANHQGEWLKIPQLGKVIIHDAVEIGANTTIDRGALGDTILHQGVKLDNQIQIGHNVEIGEHTAIAACSGVSGSTKIGKHCMISGMVGFTGHFEIADKVVITGMTMVSKSIKESGIYSSGTAIESHATWKKNAVRFRQLDEMARKIDKLERELEKLMNA